MISLDWVDPRQLLMVPVDSADISYLVADYSLLLNVIQRWNGKASLVLWIHIKVDIAEMRKMRVNWVWRHVVSW